MVILLQRAPEARRVYTHIVHARANTDGHKGEGVTFPSGAVQRDLLQEVYNHAGVSPLDVSYVEAHGTGTKVSHTAELSCLQNSLEIYCIWLCLYNVYTSLLIIIISLCMHNVRLYETLLRSSIDFSQAGDPQEVGALAEVFCCGRSSPLMIGSVKSNMGHSEPASGLCSIIKVSTPWLQLNSM